jgi:hypothetical protein
MSPAGLAVGDPALAGVLIGIEALAATLGTLLLITTLTLAALRGSETTSERAFRLLDLLGGGPGQRPARPPRDRGGVTSGTPIGPHAADAFAAASTQSRPVS